MFRLLDSAYAIFLLVVQVSIDQNKSHCNPSDTALVRTIEVVTYRPLQ